MKRRIMCAAGAAMFVVTLLPGSAAARPPETAGLRRLDAETLRRLRAVEDLGPSALQARRPVTVVVELAAPSVADEQAAAIERDPARPLTSAQRQAIGERLAAEQRGLRPNIRALGGRVLAGFRHAVNGLKVSIAPGHLDELAGLPGVERVHAVPIYRRRLVQAGAYAAAQQAWGQTGRTGAGVTIAVVDTGIDYTHATFGGSGDPADFAGDDGLSRATGHAFPTAKVVEGWDFAGDAYDPEDPDHATPAPDDDPLDCAIPDGGDGHGTHVAAIAAGAGVERVAGADSTFTGPYDSTTYTSTTFVVGPGVAPEAKLVALRIFGCAGGSDLVIDAIDRAVELDVDVINLSLGTVFARADDIVSLAVDAASDAGIVVVGSAGNDGPSGYIHGGIATASKAIAVGAVDGRTMLPRALVKPVGRTQITGRNVNGAIELPVTGALRIVPGPGGISDGCAASDYAGFRAGRIAVVMRGDCSLVEKGALAEAAGAVGIVVVNDQSSGLPPYIGPQAPDFTIPMVGVRRSARSELVAANGISTKLRATTPSRNPNYGLPAEFTSSGPRTGDSALKPDVAAAGVEVASASAGTGTKAISYSGTSMASPIVAGAAALVLERWPSWSPANVKAVLVGTASASSSKFASGGYNLLLAGSGAVSARKAADAVAFAATAGGDAGLSFGYDQIGGGGYSESRSFRIFNHGNSSITYDLSSSFNGASHGATLSLSRTSVTVPAHSSRSVTATLRLTASRVAQLPDALVPGDVSEFGWFFQPVTTVMGAIRARPTTSGNGRHTLRVPFLAVPRGTSNVNVANIGAYTTRGDQARFTATLRNTGDTGHAGTADIYAWGLSDSNEGHESSDLRAVGVQSFVCDDPLLGCTSDDRLLAFAVNTWGRWSNISTEEFAVLVDVDDDDVADSAVFTADAGATTIGFVDGTSIVLTCSLDTEGVCEDPASGGFLDGFFIDQAPNGSTAWLPTVGNWLGLDADDRLRYTAASTNVIPGGGELVDWVEAGGGLAWAPWNPWAPAINQGDFYPLAPGQTQSHTFRVFRSNMAADGAPMGWMIVALDDRNGARQADLVPLGSVPRLP